MRPSAKTLVVAVAAAALGCGRDSPGGRRVGAGGTDSLGSPPSAPQGIARRDVYVGNRYESLPRGVSYLSGAVLPASHDGAEYEVAYVKTPQGEMIWFDSLAHTSRSTPTRTVRAELSVPALARDERLFLASCDVGGKLDPRVVAIAVNEPSVTTFAKVRQAWRVNAERGEFEPMPVTDITCEETGGG